MPKMKMRDWLAQAQEFPTQAEAERYRLANGIEIEGEDTGELPPVSEQQGALDAAAQAADTEKEDTGAEDTGAVGGLDLASIDFDQFQTNPGALLKSLFAANQAAEKERAASAKKLYEEADKRIMEKYAGPSQAERLFALSRAMLSPTDFPGFKGFLGNVTGALSENAKAAREAEQLRQQKQFENYLQYQKGEIERAAARPKTALDMARVAAGLNKPQWVRSVNPDTAEVTLTPVYPGQAAPGGQTASGGGAQPTFQNTRYIDRPTDMIKLPPAIKFFIAKDDPSQTPRPIPGR